MLTIKLGGVRINDYEKTEHVPFMIYWKQCAFHKGLYSLQIIQV